MFNSLDWHELCYISNEDDLLRSKGMDAVGTVHKLAVTLEEEKQFEKLSPSELKGELFNSSKN